MGYRVGSILLFALAQLRFFAFAPFCFCVLFLELLCFFAFVPMNFFVIPSHYFLISFLLGLLFSLAIPLFRHRAFAPLRFCVVWPLSRCGLAKTKERSQTKAPLPGVSESLRFHYKRDTRRSFFRLRRLRSRNSEAE